MRDKARLIAAHLLECSADDLEWEAGRWQVKGSPERAKTIQELAFAAWAGDSMPAGVEPNLEATTFYDPPNFTFPFGSHIAEVEIDAETGKVTIERYTAIDDCGNVINPMIVEGRCTAASCSRSPRRSTRRRSTTRAARSSRARSSTT